MINPQLERRYADCTELVEAWKQYLELYNRAVKEDDFQPTAELEQRFLDTKARIAMLHDSFMESLHHDQNVGQNMLSIVNRSITLRHLRRLGQADQKKIEIEWHETYLLLNETLTQVGEERERLADINELTFRLGKIRERLFVNIRAFLNSGYFKGLVALAILGVLIGILIFVEIPFLRENERTSKYYAMLQDFKRDTLGMQAPYSSIESFLNRYLTEEEMPSGYSNPQTLEGQTKESVADAFQDSFPVGAGGADEALRGAASFAARSFSPPGDVQNATVYVFFWNETGPASSFAYSFLSTVNDPENQMAPFLDQYYGVLHDNNVLVIIQGPPQDVREQIRRDVFN